MCEWYFLAVSLICSGPIVDETVKVNAGGNVDFTCSVDTQHQVLNATLCFEPTVNFSYNFPNWNSQTNIGNYAFKNFSDELNETSVSCAVWLSTGESYRSNYITILVIPGTVKFCLSYLAFFSTIFFLDDPFLFYLLFFTKWLSFTLLLSLCFNWLRYIRR